MEKVKVYEKVSVAKEEESCYNQIDTSLPKKKRSKSNQEDNTEKPKKPR